MSKLLFTKTHEWVKIEDNIASVGLSDYAQSSLGDLVFVNLPEVGAQLTCGEPACDVESVKAVSDLYSPVCGSVVEVNRELEGAPELINSNPLDTWIFRAEVEELGDLMDEQQYAEYVKGL